MDEVGGIRETGARRPALAFGPFRLEPTERTLYRDGTPLPAPLKDIEVLLVLVASRGRVVTKEEIFAAVWPDVIVEEGTLTRHVSSVRRLLGDGEGGARYIETHPKRGYRFVVPVLSIPADPAPDRPRRRGRGLALAVAIGLAVATALVARVATRPGERSVDATSIRSLVVLPLENLTGDARQEFVADALTEELVTHLGRSPRLRVISRTSAMRYKGTRETVPEIARTLRVDGVVEGSVLRVAERVRVSVQLIDARRDAHLWAETFDVDPGAAAALPAAVARGLFARLGDRLPEEGGPGDRGGAVAPEAWRAQALGRHFLGRRTGDDILRAVRHFSQAVAREPRYARAHAGLAQAYALAAEYRAMPPAESFPLARAAAERALALDPLSGEAHAALGAILEDEWDWEGAERALRRAVELAPSDASAHQWLGEVLMLRGRAEQALAAARRARDLDPASPIVNAVLGILLHYAGRTSDAEAQLRATLDLDPGFAVAHEMLGRALDAGRKHAEAVASFRRAVELSGGSPEYLAALACSLARGGERAEPEALLGRLREEARLRYVSPVELAMVEAALGERDQAFSSLERAWEERSTWLPWLWAGPGLPELEGDPRLALLRRRVGLAAEGSR